MVIDAIVGTLMAIVTGVLGLLPSWDPGLGGLSSASTALGQALGFANAYFPVTALGVCLGSLIGGTVAVQAWKLALFIYDRLPFKAT